MLTYLNQNEVTSLAASPAMRKVCDQIRLLANVNVPVLIIVEARTGKETTGRLLHGYSSRRERRFRNVNCTGTTPRDVESELFGFTERSFSATILRVAWSAGILPGVLFLEDIGELPLMVQSNLLHVMEKNNTSGPARATR